MFKKTDRKNYITIHTSEKKGKPEVPEGLLKKCNACKAAIVTEDVQNNDYICPKCGCHEYDSDQFQATGGNFAKLFDVQNKKFITVSCRECGYTELYVSGILKLPAALVAG